MPDAVPLPVDEALSRLDIDPEYDAGNGPGPCVHTMAQAAFGLLGANWYLPDVEALFRKEGVSEAGPMAASTGHGLVVTWDDNGFHRTVFFATTASKPFDPQPEENR